MWKKIYSKTIALKHILKSVMAIPIPALWSQKGELHGYKKNLPPPRSIADSKL